MAYPNRPPPPPPSLCQTMGSTNIEFKTEMRFDPSYIKSQMGILRIVIFVFNLIGVICISSSPFIGNTRGVLFLIIAISGIIYTGSITYAYVFHLVEKFHNWQWMKIEMFTCIGLVFCNMVTSTVVVAFGSAAFSAAGFFGYLCMTLYGAEAFLRAGAIKSGIPAQGTIVTTKQQHVVPTPA